VLQSEKSAGLNPYDVLSCPEDLVLAKLKEPIDKWKLLNKKTGG
jgi:hypothetical protein